MEFVLFANLGATLHSHFFVEISRTLWKFKFSYIGFCTECMTVRKKQHLGHINHEKKKNIFKYNLNITYLKNLILLIMQFFEKSGAIDR